LAEHQLQKAARECFYQKESKGKKEEDIVWGKWGDKKAIYRIVKAGSRLTRRKKETSDMKERSKEGRTAGGDQHWGEVGYSRGVELRPARTVRFEKKHQVSARCFGSQKGRSREGNLDLGGHAHPNKKRNDT